MKARASWIAEGKENNPNKAVSAILEFVIELFINILNYTASMKMQVSINLRKPCKIDI